MQTIFTPEHLYESFQAEGRVPKECDNIRLHSFRYYQLMQYSWLWYRVSKCIVSYGSQTAEGPVFEDSFK
jgi:hypothetical protein